MTPDFLRNDLVNSLDENALVMAPVENRELSISRHLFVFSPQETMIELFRCRFFEVGDADTLRVDSLKNPVYDSVFAASIHGLQNNYDFLLVLCVEHFLKLSKFLVELLRLYLFILILSLET